MKKAKENKVPIFTRRDSGGGNGRVSPIGSQESVKSKTDRMVSGLYQIKNSDLIIRKSVPDPFRQQSQALSQLTHFENKQAQSKHSRRGSKNSRNGTQLPDSINLASIK